MAGVSGSTLTRSSSSLDFRTVLLKVASEIDYLLTQALSSLRPFLQRSSGSDISASIRQLIESREGFLNLAAIDHSETLYVVFRNCWRRRLHNDTPAADVKVSVRIGLSHLCQDLSDLAREKLVL
jgi:hypothetical protein